jgi:hypothetical protein
MCQTQQRCGFTQCLTEEGGALTKAMQLAEQIACNLPLTNCTVQAMPMIRRGQFSNRAADGISNRDAAPKPSKRNAGYVRCSAARAKCEALLT